MSRALEAARFIRELILAADIQQDMYEDRVYFSIAPQDATYPMVVFDVISRNESATQDLGSAVDEYRFQVDVLAHTTAAKSAVQRAHECADAIRTALTRKDNSDLGEEFDYQFDTIQDVNHITDYLPDVDLYRVTNDYLIRVKTGSPGPIVNIGAGVGVPVLTAATNNYSTDEQVWNGATWINGETIYWRTWELGNGADGYVELTGLIISGVETIVDVEGRYTGAAGYVETAFALNTQVAPTYRIYLGTGENNATVTVWYTKA